MKTLIKYLSIHVMLVLLFTGCKSSEIAEESAEQAIELYTVEDLIGDWKSVKYEYDQDKQSLVRFRSAEALGYNSPEYNYQVWDDSNNIIHPVDEDTYISTTNNYLRIETDSMFWLNYPLEMHGRAAYRLDSNKVWLRRSYKRKLLSMSEDRQEMTFSYLDMYGLYITQYYEKVEFDDSLIGILKAHELNYPMLAGCWLLVRYDNSDGEIYKLDFPYEISDSLELNEVELIKAMQTDKSIMMTTGGVRRKYFIEYYEGELRLKPGSWFDQEPYKAKGYYNGIQLFYKNMCDSPGFFSEE